MINSGGRAGGACTAAIFLKEFTNDLPWVHLDIAGTARGRCGVRPPRGLPFPAP